MFVITTATKKLLGLKKRIKAVQGGTSAGKTISILQILIDKAQRDTRPTLTSVVSESFPHLKRGAMRDFLMIMQEHKYFRDSQWNRSDFTYTFETGSKIEFFSADQPSKVRGPRRYRLFLNECNNVPYEAFDQLEVRTKEEIWLDWNPTNEFWFYDEVNNRGDVEHIILTYLDNEGLSQEIVDSIEQRRNRTSWWRVYGEGLLGEVEGKIYRNWEILEEIPRFARLERRGLDFGYSNDPTAIVDIYYADGGYIFDEVTYQKGLSNRRIADILMEREDNSVMVVADSAEPKSIDEIKSYGLNIQPVAKKKQGPRGSFVEWSIQLVQDQRCAITKRSVNLIKEYRNYLWKVDKDGNVVVNPSVPEHEFSHGMDAIRYGMVSLLTKPTFKMVASDPLPDYYENWN
jgi:phage terminase large subunit